jgi:polyisoprenoid-binding protein YceI
MASNVRTICSAVLFAVALPYVGAAQSIPGRDRMVDADASTVGFTVSAKMLFTVERHGKFDEFAGLVSYAPDRPGETRVELTVYTASVDTRDPDQDALLRSTDFFDTERFPTMRFVSTSAAIAGDRTLTMTGDLTIHGITKRLAVPIRIVPSNSSTAAATRFETEFDIDRTEFGLNGRPNWKGLNVSIGRKVRIHLAIATGSAGR